MSRASAGVDRDHARAGNVAVIDVARDFLGLGGEVRNRASSYLVENKRVSLDSMFVGFTTNFQIDIVVTRYP